MAVLSSLLAALFSCAAPQTAPNALRVGSSDTPGPAQTSTPASTASVTSRPEMPPAPARARRARVTRVVDGDTIVITGIDVGEVDRSTGGRKARLIGVDTPEVFGGGECLGREASAFTKRTLEGTPVLADFDFDAIDRYGRALVYVWLVDGTFFNGKLVAEGFALPMTVPPNVRYADEFVRLAGEARRAERGLWSLC